jgi:hypothetical protein
MTDTAMIKFECPHCQKKLSVKDELAGKKGACPGCKKVLLVPALAPAAAVPAPAKAVAKPKPAAPAAPQEPPPAPVTAPPPLPAPSDEDLEAAAAAALSDGPTAPVDETTPEFIELQCPMCDEPVKFPVDLAGKKASCPSCRRVIKVPELVKQEKKDWRQSVNRLPSGAKRPDQPEPEGAWGTAATTTVSKDSLEEAGAIPELREPSTIGQKVMRGVLVCIVLLLLGGGYWALSNMWSASREQRLVKVAQEYAANQEQAFKEVGREGVAALHGLLGEHHLRARRPIAEARGQFDRAIVLLQSGEEFQYGANERDLILTDVAVLAVELGGSQDEVDKNQRLKWEDAHKVIRQALTAISGHEARREAFRDVLRRLRDRNQLPRGLALAAQAFEDRSAQAEAYALVGLAAHSAGNEDLTKKAGTAALALYDGTSKTRLVPEVVAVAQLIKREQPDPKASADNLGIGQAEALARQGNWEGARAEVQKLKGPRAQVLARLALADAALDAKSKEGNADLEAAAGVAEKDLGGRPGEAWTLYRLVKLGARTGLADDSLKATASLVLDADLRGHGQLAILQARLARDNKVTEETALDGLEAKSLAPLLGRAALARNNTHHDKGWLRNIEKWEKGAKAFGAIGAALGLQKD